MRLRVMELPVEYVGEASTTPFAFVVDRCSEADVESWTDDIIDGAKESSGARAVFVFRGDVELEGDPSKPEPRAAVYNFGIRSSSDEVLDEVLHRQRMRGSNV